MARRSWREHTEGALREAGFRAGGARAAVLDLLAGQDCCASAQEIHDEPAWRAVARSGSRRSTACSRCSRSSGSSQRVDVGDGIARFEPALADGEHHHHVVCDDCGKVEPFSDPSLETAIAQRVAAAGLQRRRARGRAARRVRRLPRRLRLTAGALANGRRLSYVPTTIERLLSLPVPDYEVDDVLVVSEADQLRALTGDARLQIVALLRQRAASTTELAAAIGLAKGTVAHHLKVLERAGLVRVVWTRRVRALTESFYGRMARLFLLMGAEDYEEPCGCGRA